MKSRRIIVDTSKYIVGSALRNFVWTSEGKSFALSCDERVEVGDVILAEVIDKNDDKLDSSIAPSNYVERLYFNRGKSVLRNERIESGDLVIITAGNRYSTKSFTGGIENPITGEPNDPIRPGKIIQNLGHFNICGVLNYNYGEEKPATLRVLGILMDDSDIKVNIGSYPRFKFNNKVTSRSRKCIIVAGDDTESGKTTCCAMIAYLCKNKGIRFIYQKISGGPRVKDMIAVISPELHFRNIGDDIHFSVDANALDFVDIGFISSHSVANFNEYCDKSLYALDCVCEKHSSELAIVEIAGNYSQLPNRLIMQHCNLINPHYYFVIVASYGIEAATCVVEELVRNRIELDRIAISGILTSATNSEMFRAIVTHEVGCQWLPTTPRIKENANAKKQWELFIFKD